jgi:hypothetical protein
MLHSRFKLAVVDRLVRGVRAAGERSLALLITAGVASCGGETTPPGDASADQHSDAPSDSTVIVEAPAYDSAVPDAGASDAIIVEAPNFDAGAG